MPEGNTIHWLARVHARDYGGRRVRAASPQGRFAREARRLDGRRFEAAEAYGKHLFHHWEGGLVVHVHLGMAGWFYRHPPPAPPPRPTVRLRLATRDVTTDLIGPPTCELIPEFERRKLLARLGPDPLRRDFDPDRARAELARRPRRTIGDALLDQRVLAGVGNIYRAEALFLTGIHPKRSSASLSDAEWERLWKTVRALMRRGVVRGRIRTIEKGEPPAHPLAGRGPADAFYVYQQGVCRRCGSPIEEFPMSARRMFACPDCQPGPRRRAPTRARKKSGRNRRRRASAP
jgi:endonuclease-8